MYDTISLLHSVGVGLYPLLKIESDDHNKNQIV